MGWKRIVVLIFMTTIMTCSYLYAGDKDVWLKMSNKEKSVFILGFSRGVGLGCISLLKSDNNSDNIFLACQEEYKINAKEVAELIRRVDDIYKNGNDTLLTFAFAVAIKNMRGVDVDMSGF